MALFENFRESREWRQFVEYYLIWIPITILCLIVLPFLWKSIIEDFRKPEPAREIPPIIEPEGEVHTFILDPKYCEGEFSLDPLDFCAQRGAGSRVENAYVSAHVSENGDLILEVAENQLLEWKKKDVSYQLVQLIMGRKTTPGWDPADHDWAAFYIEHAPISGIEIAEDYSWYIVDFDKDYDFSPFLTFGMTSAQLFEKKNSYEIDYECIYRYNGEIWAQYNISDGPHETSYPEGIGPGFHPTDTDSDSSSSKVQ